MPDATGSFDAERGRRQLLAALGAGAAAGVAGCSADSPLPPSTPSEEGSVTVRLWNRDDTDREFEIVVNQGDGLTDSLSGVLPAGQEEPIEMVATFRITDGQYDFSIGTVAGRYGRTWDPNECGDFLVQAFVADGEVVFDTECRGE